jgi:hypothetical protein
MPPPSEAGSSLNGIDLLRLPCSKEHVKSHLFHLQAMIHIVFKDPVDWTKKITTTQPNPTECNQTISCSCSILESIGLLVASIQKYLKTVQKPVATGLFTVYTILLMYSKLQLL